VVTHPFDHLTVGYHIVRKRGSDVVDVLAFELDCGAFFLIRWASNRNTTDSLCPLGDSVGTCFEVLVGLLKEQMQIAELRTLDVPVVFVNLVVENVGVGEIRIQRVDDLLGFLLFKPQCVGFFDRVCLLADDFLCTHNNYTLLRHPLKS